MALRKLAFSLLLVLGLSSCTGQQAYVRSNLLDNDWNRPQRIYVVMRETRQTGLFLKFMEEPLEKMLAARAIEAEIYIVPPFDEEDGQLALRINDFGPDAVLKIRQKKDGVPAIGDPENFANMSFTSTMTDYARRADFWEGDLLVDCQAGMGNHRCAEMAAVRLIERLGADRIIPSNEVKPPKEEKPKKKNKTKGEPRFSDPDSR